MRKPTRIRKIGCYHAYNTRSISDIRCSFQAALPNKYTQKHIHANKQMPMKEKKYAAMLLFALLLSILVPIFFVCVVGIVVVVVVVAYGTHRVSLTHLPIRIQFLEALGLFQWRCVVFFIFTHILFGFATQLWACACVHAFSTEWIRTAEKTRMKYRNIHAQCALRGIELLSERFNSLWNGQKNTTHNLLALRTLCACVLLTNSLCFLFRCVVRVNFESLIVRKEKKMPKSMTVYCLGLKIRFALPM